MRENLFELSRNKALNRYYTIFLKRKIIKKMIKVIKKMNYNKNGNENN